MVRKLKQAAVRMVVPAAALLGLCTVQPGMETAWAQQASAQALPQASPVHPVARITQAVDDASTVTLHGNTHPLASPRYDRGAAPESLPTGRMQMVLKRSQEQETALKSFLDAVHNPSSPQFHQFLTPEQFGQQFGVADSDIQTVTAWLQAHGFSVDKVNKARTVVQFSGSVGQVQAAFHTAIHRFVVDNVPGITAGEHYANTSDPQIPAALAPVIAGITSLNNFSPHPAIIRRGRAQYDPTTHQATLLHPDLTVSSSSKTYYLVGPADFDTIYNVNPIYSQTASGAAVNGTGVTIGIIGDSNISTSDVDNYRSFFSLPAKTPQVVIDGTDPGINGDYTEALLDTEISGGIAPGANIVLYTAGDTTLDFGLFLALQRALDDNTANIVNLSFGECEAFLGASGNAVMNGYWQEAAAQGISVTVSTDDSGSAGCDNPNTEGVAENGLAVNGLASTPYNIAVGGTDFNQTTTNVSTYWNSTSGTGGLSAKSYIPEIPWNDSTTTIGALSGNDDSTLKAANTNNIVGAGGGISNCTQSTTTTNSANVTTYACTPGSGYAKPSWQTGSGVPSDGHRDLPDVSLFAADLGHLSAWAFCISGTDPTTNQAFTDCSGSSPTIDAVGGTSASAPAMAGILALIDQKYGPQGQADYVLYPLAAQHGSAFHDITTGNNSVACAPSGTSLLVTGKAADCVAVSASGSDPFLNGYNAGTGYDLATGLGSFDANALFTNWGAITFKPSATTLAVTKADGTALPASIPHGTLLSVSTTVASSPAGGTPTPTGPVSLLGPNNSALATLTLNSSGTGTQNPFNNLPGGSYQLFANYGGDGVYAASKSAGLSVTVAPEASTLNLFAGTPGPSFASTGGLTSVANQSVAYGTYIAVEAQPVSTAYASVANNPNPAPSNATGFITFSDSGQALPSGNGGTPGKYGINSNDYSEVPLNYFNVGAHSVSASYPGDPSYNASTAGPIPFTITQAATATALSADTTTPIAGGTVNLTVTLTSHVPTGAAAPTGTFTLKSGTTALGTAVTLGSSGAQPAQDSVGNWTVSAQIPLSAASFAAGANSVTATYSGDANYAGSTSTAITITGPVSGPAITLASSGNITVVAGAATGNTATIKVTPSGGFTGNVALTCAVGGAAAGATAPTCSLNPASVAVSGTSAANSTLTIATAAGTTTAGTYTATVSGADSTGKITNNVAVTVTVTGSVPAPAITLASSGNITVVAGAATGNTATIKVTPSGGFAGNVALTCAVGGAAAGATAPTCSLNPASVAISGTSAATSTLTIGTTARSSGANHLPATNSRWWETGGGAVLACVLLFGIPARRRSWQSMLGLLFVVMVFAASGCGGGSSGNGGGGGGGTTGTTAGTYTVTVSGADSTGKVTNNVAVTVTVQ